MRVVLDTNVFIASIGKMSPYRPIFDSLRAGKFVLLISAEIFLEYLEVLEKLTSQDVALNIGRGLEESEFVDAVSIHFFWQAVSADPDDNKFFDCAIAGNADYLVTNDQHFNELKESDFPKMNIISANQFISLLN
jgi:putative PIN family toxin of toxin-antitoxin system